MTSHIDAAALIKAVETERHHVVVDSYTPTWNELLSQFAAGDVKINPEYQRAFRWSLAQQTSYIESVLLNIPTPPLFFAETPDGKFEVIDGLQRFSTVIRFFSGELRSSAPGVMNSYANIGAGENDITVPSVLSGGPIINGLLGVSRENIPDTLARTLRYARVQVILLQKESSSLARYNVFMRLNRAGTVLSNQEIRNCSARLFSSQFANYLMVLGNEPCVKAALGLSDKELAAMGAQECVLRLISFSHFSPLSQRIDEFLDAVMYECASSGFKLTSNIRKSIVRTFEVISNAFPAGQAFRFLRSGEFKGAFSSNLFDIVACGVYKNLAACESRGAAAMRKLIKDLHKQSEAIALTGAGSNTRAKMAGRTAFGIAWFK